MRGCDGTTVDNGFCLRPIMAIMLDMNALGVFNKVNGVRLLPVFTRDVETSKTGQQLLCLEKRSSCL